MMEFLLVGAYLMSSLLYLQALNDISRLRMWPIGSYLGAAERSLDLVTEEG